LGDTGTGGEKGTEQHRKSCGIVRRNTGWGSILAVPYTGQFAVRGKGREIKKSQRGTRGRHDKGSMTFSSSHTKKNIGARRGCNGNIHMRRDAQNWNRTKG